GRVAHAVDLLHPRADRGAEDDEVQGGRDDRRRDALEQGAQGAGDLEEVDGADGVEVHEGLTRLTKISSRERCFVWRSVKSMPAASTARRRPARPESSPW